jgi:anti-sigma factor RsiW
MASCREIDPLFAAYVDGEATAEQRELVDAHLRACPKCRHQTALQAAVRESVRTKLCRPCAPEQLRVRYRAAAHTGPFGTRRGILINVSLAAAVVLAAGGVLLYGLSRVSPAVLAAQLTLDHVACFAWRESEGPADPRASEERYAREYDQRISLPRISMPGLQLVNVGRCYSGEGAAAHAMYRLNGNPVSLYIIPGADRGRAAADVFGYDALVWSRENTTYVLVSSEPRQTSSSWWRPSKLETRN